MPEQHYPYEDEQGNVLYRVVRYGRKNFRQEHPENGGWTSGRGTDNTIPYRLPEVLEAIDQGEPVWICEGEKDAETARMQGLTATCNSGGAGKWNREISQWFRSAEPVYIVWDNDREGRRHALIVENFLKGVGVSDIHFRRAAVGKDLTDHIAAGKTIEQLIRRRPALKVTEEVDADDVESDFLPSPFQLALAKLNKVTPELGKENQYNALCPAHDDVSPSLSIRPGDDVAVMAHCHAGCTIEQIARALGINPLEFTAMPAKKLDKQEALNEQAYMRKKANEHAEQRLMQERSVKKLELSDNETFVEVLKKPLVPTKWLIDSWFKSSTAVLLNADPKAGKTRLTLNFIKSLSENEPFLGRFQTNMPEGRIWYGNWDMPEDLMHEYLHDYNWLAPDRLILKNIGSMEFPFWVRAAFDDFVEYARRMSIKLMIVDTLHVASQGYVTDENDNNEMSAFVHLLRSLCEVAGIPNLFVIHHTGHSSAHRGRGASTLAADFDGMWFLHNEDSERFDSPRQLSAKGRKLGVAPIDLGYSMSTESYTYGGSLPARSGSDSVDPDLMSDYLAYVERVREYQTGAGKWPSLGEARRLTKKKTKDVTSYMRAVLNLGLVARRPAVGAKHEEIYIP